jgi:hypothetical protein
MMLQILTAARGAEGLPGCRVAERPALAAGVDYLLPRKGSLAHRPDFCDPIPALLASEPVSRAAKWWPDLTET